MEILKPSFNDIPAIISLATHTWHTTYSSIISKEQIEYMLQLFYNNELIASQFSDPSHFFLLAKEENQLLGYSHCYIDQDKLKLSKLYISPLAQGKGIGKKLLNQIEADMIQLNIHTLILNVNRNNPALHFYIKMGFEIIDTIDIPLDKFWLNDYVMQKTIS